jgi:Uncharacterized protein conserved in bacteria
MNYWYFFLPLIAALIGWLVNHIATLFLFHPRHPRRFLGMRIQGLIPRRQEELAKSLGSFAARAFSFDDIEKKINDPQHWERIKPVVEKHIDEFLRTRLGKEMPMISMFIGDKTIETLKKVFMQEIGTLFPQVIGQFAGNIRNELDVQSSVTKKIASIPTIQLQQLFQSGLARETRAFKLLGALTGFIIGVIQVLVFLFFLS